MTCILQGWQLAASSQLRSDGTQRTGQKQNATEQSTPRSQNPEIIIQSKHRQRDPDPFVISRRTAGEAEPQGKRNIISLGRAIVLL